MVSTLSCTSQVWNMLGCLAIPFSSHLIAPPLGHLRTFGRDSPARPDGLEPRPSRTISPRLDCLLFRTSSPRTRRPAKTAPRGRLVQLPGVTIFPTQDGPYVLNLVRLILRASIQIGARP